MNELEYREALTPMPVQCAAEDDAYYHRMKHEVKISQLDYGYVVSVGCKSFAIETPEKLLAYLTEYITKPGETEKKFYAKELF